MNDFIKWFIRGICGILIIIYAVFRISIPVINNEKLYLDTNDGYVLMGSVVLLIVYESIRVALSGAVKLFFRKLLNKLNSK